MSAQLSPPPASITSCGRAPCPGRAAGTVHRAGERRRQRFTEAQPVGKSPKGVQPHVGDDPGAAGFHDDATRAGTVHFGSALLVWGPVA